VSAGIATGCKRENVTVEAGKTYRIRMINAGSLAFLSVCFSGHNVTVFAADAYPIIPLNVSCVDINLGQRCALGLFPSKAGVSITVVCRARLASLSWAGEHMKSA
jgi:FtsP/CotA-like multicopper oxidase with cupredoxin domain